MLLVEHERGSDDAVVVPLWYYGNSNELDELGELVMV